MRVIKPLGEEQLQNITNFYLDHRQFMTEDERFIFELVIERKNITVEESYIMTKLHNELKNLK